MDLRKALENWTDFDGAMHHVGVALGLFPANSKAYEYKWVFWSNNQIGRGVIEIMGGLVSCGALEFDDEEARYRWNGGFDKNGLACDDQVQRTFSGEKGP